MIHEGSVLWLTFTLFSTQWLHHTAVILDTNKSSPKICCFRATDGVSLSVRTETIKVCLSRFEVQSWSILDAGSPDVRTPNVERVLVPDISYANYVLNNFLKNAKFCLINLKAEKVVKKQNKNENRIADLKLFVINGCR